MKSVTVFSIVLLLGASLSPLGAAQIDTRLEGLVVGFDGRPAEGFRVHLIDESGNDRGQHELGARAAVSRDRHILCRPRLLRRCFRRGFFHRLRIDRELGQRVGWNFPGRRSVSSAFLMVVDDVVDRGSSHGDGTCGGVR